MNNALLYLGGLLVVTLAALFAVPHFVDWNGYRGIFEEEATKVLGRDVRVGGAVNVRFLPTPFVSFEKVRLADPTGQTGEPFVRADSFTMRLSGPALLRGVLEANEIELHRPILTLALDDKGGGNWSSMQIKAGSLPFVPQDVALHSVKIIDGVVAFYNNQAQQILRAEAINGEFSADALKGPFKFKGQATWSGEIRDIKFATTEPDRDGALLLKASMRAEKSTATYLLDGRVEDLSGRPRLAGTLTGKLPVVVQASGTVAAAQKATASADTPIIDLKSNVEVTTSGAKVDDIALSVDNAAEPQLIAGAATAVWGKEPRLDIALNSKWLDLDRLAGAGQDSATFVRVKQLGLSMLHALASDGNAGAKIEVDQVKLGGETAGGLKINAERHGSSVRLTELKAGLPGGSRLDLSGDLKDDTGKISFTGSGFIHGTNLARLLDWAAKSGADLDLNGDGPFSAEGRVLLNDTRFELTEASADVGGRPFSGDVIVSGEGRRRVAVTLEAARLDSRELFTDTAKALEDNLRRAFGLTAGDANASRPAAASDDKTKTSTEPGDISVRVLAGELKHGDQVYRNVNATVGLDGGNIRIPSAKFTTASGLVVGIEGRIDNAAQQPKGLLAYDFTATTPEALTDLGNVTGLAAIVPVGRLARVGSANVAGLVHLGTRGKATADVSVDGTVQNARISGHAEFDGGLQGWRAEPSRVSLTARAQTLAPLLAAFGAETSGTTQQSGSEAEFVFASTGPLATGAAASVEISAPGFEVGYHGYLAMPADTPVALFGDVQLKVAEALDALALASIGTAKGIAGTPLEGKIEVKRDGAVWTLASRQLAVGRSKLDGSVKIDATADGPAAISGDVHADTITISGLLAALLDKPANPGDADGELWPESGFNFDGLSHVAGDLRLRFDALQIAPGVVARDGGFNVALAPGKASIGNMAGRAAGGALSGGIQLVKSPGGVALDGSVKIDGAELSKIGSSARGKATLDVKGTAQAQSPAALFSVLAGNGTLALEGARVAGPSAATGSDVVAAVFSNKVPNQAEAVTSAIETALPAATADLGTRTVSLTIADGVAKLDPVTVESSSGTVTSVTAVDLISLSLSSVWKLASIVPPLPPLVDQLPGWVAPPAKGPLPPVSIAYSGPIGDLAALNVNVDAADMQRELTVRQMERNVEELERLRKLDEHRAKVELERRQQIEAERAAAKAAAQGQPLQNQLPQGQPPQGGAAQGQTPQGQQPAQVTAPAPQSQAPQGQPAPAQTSQGQTLPPVLPESAGIEAGAQTPAGTDTTDPNTPGAAVPPNGTPITPGVENPATARPQPVRVSPARSSSSRRTSSDEVMRSLGGFP